MSQQTGFARTVDTLTVRRAQRGDRAALADLYEAYAGAAYTLALRLTARPDVAQDVVHEAYLKLLERIGSYRGEAPFGAWFKRLVGNTAIDRLRSEAWLDADTDAEAQATTPGRGAEQVHEAVGLLARLPAPARSVVVLHELEGYSHTEIAALTGRSESWSKSVLSRALTRLRAELEQEMSLIREAMP
ncbi:MAG TPA: RNA polymerase sigma factor [Xanthomonadaceae bacterium]|nr:RNA polymerase sigma factor [Xanthomonadaceae bacterium]